MHYVMARNIEAGFNAKEEIFIKDMDGLKKKIAQVKKDGVSKLYVLTDFDYTLTRRSHENEKADNSFKTIENVRHPLTLLGTNRGKSFPGRVRKGTQ